MSHYFVSRRARLDAGDAAPLEVWARHPGRHCCDKCVTLRVKSMARLNADQFMEIFPFFTKGPATLIKDILSSSPYAFTHRDTAMQIEGQLYADLELVLVGEKRIYRASPAGKQIPLYEVGPGEACILNAACVLSDTPSPVNSTAITDVSYLLIPDKDFRDLISKYEEMRAFVFDSISRRVVTVLDLLGEIVFEKMDQRLFDYIVEKSENARLVITHQQIANDLGTAREVVSRLLKDFERKGKIVLSRGHIHVKDR